MPTLKAVSVIHLGQTNIGWWHLDGKIAVLSSAYGSASTSTSKGEANEDTASAILAELVELWRP